MNWTELLRKEIDYTYANSEKLMNRVEEKDLAWKPPTGSNWMTTGQVLMHMTNACGASVKGFVTGDWGFPEDFDPSQMKPEDMLPPAEKLPTVGSVAEAKRLLAEDKKTALAMIEKAGEERLAKEPAPAPWDERPIPLGERLMSMVYHLTAHKAQLYYYLKLQGKPVSTHDLWGM